MLTLALDASQLTIFCKCPEMWKYSYRENIVRKGIKREALDMGTVIHGLLDAYYRGIWQGMKKDAAMAYAVSRLDSFRQLVKLDPEVFRFLGNRFMFYVMLNKTDNWKIITVIKEGKKEPAIEQGFSISLVKNDSFHFVLEGKIDLLVETPNGLRVVIDHKTQGRKYDYYGQSIQARTYSFATGFRYFQHNYIGLQEKAKPEYFRRSEPVYMSAKDQERWRKWLIGKFYAAASMIMENSFYNHRNPATCSDAGFGKQCQYTRVCEKDDLIVIEQTKHAFFEERKPWEPWTLEMETQEE